LNGKYLTEELTDVTFALYTANVAHEEIGFMVLEPKNDSFLVINKIVATLFTVLFHELQH
jgi:hypothetical protein